MLLFVDNFDSFTYNLVQYFEVLGAEVRVIRNDLASEFEALIPLASHLVLGPGPGAPAQAGITLSAIQRYAGTLPILGVCLGHQAIGEAFGGKVVRAKRVMHGKQSRLWHNGQGLFAGLPQGYMVTRYHSLIIDPEILPDELEVTAWTEEGEIMGLRHREHCIEGVQFHPESVITEHGLQLLDRFLHSEVRAEVG